MTQARNLKDYDEEVLRFWAVQARWTQQAQEAIRRQLCEKTPPNLCAQDN